MALWGCGEAAELSSNNKNVPRQKTMRARTIPVLDCTARIIFVLRVSGSGHFDCTGIIRAETLADLRLWGTVAGIVSMVWCQPRVQSKLDLIFCVLKFLLGFHGWFMDSAREPVDSPARMAATPSILDLLKRTRAAQSNATAQLSCRNSVPSAARSHGPLSLCARFIPISFTA